MKTKKNYVQAVTRRLRDEDLYIRNIPYTKIINQLMAKHTTIKEYFFSGIGLDLMYFDSLLTDYVAWKCTSRKIPVLSIHDSYIVEKKYEHLLRDFVSNPARAYGSLPLPNTSS